MSAADQARQRLETANWLKERDLQAVFAALGGDTGAVRVVGGAVRDTLLGRGTPSEIDLATTLLPETVMQRAEACGIAAVPTGIAFGTVTLVVDRRGFEVTSLRRDVETDGRHAVVRFGTDWTEDARRRDFTLNALYCGPDGTLFDPLGGIEDCLAGRVRFIGDAASRIEEDRLRIFRFFRFSASHGGEVFDAAGLKACAEAANDLGPVSAERIGHEMTRILALPRCVNTLKAMADIGLVALDAAGLQHLRRYEKTAAQPQLAGRLALLADGIGLARLKTDWRLSNALVRQIEATTRAADLIGVRRLAEAAYRFPEAKDVATDIAAARLGWPKAQTDDVRRLVMAYNPPAFPVSGAMLLQHGFTPGPELGVLLSRLETAWIDSGFTLTGTDLVARARASQPD